MSMSNTEKRVKQIRRKTRRNFSSEKKIHIVLGGLQWVVCRDCGLKTERSACRQIAEVHQIQFSVRFSSQSANNGLHGIHHFGW